MQSGQFSGKSSLWGSTLQKFYTHHQCVSFCYIVDCHTHRLCVCVGALCSWEITFRLSHVNISADGFSFLITIMADTDRAVSNLGKRRRMAQKKSLQRNKDLQHTLVAYLVECKRLNCFDNIQEDERKGGGPHRIPPSLQHQKVQRMSQQAVCHIPDRNRQLQIFLPAKNSARLEQAAKDRCGSGVSCWLQETTHFQTPVETAPAPVHM